MIEGVELMKDDMVRVIYNKKNQRGVDFIVQHLQENVIAAFGEKIANEMLGENFDVITQYGSEMEHQHAMKIKTSWEGKKFENTKPPKQQHTLFYGANKSENLYPDTSEKSYSNAVRTVQQHSNAEIAASKKENEELRSMVEDLQHKFNAMEAKQKTFVTDLKASLKRELTKEFEGMINAFKQDMSSTIANIERKFDDTIKQYETNALAREQRMNQKNLDNFRMAARELLTNTIPVTPSESTQSEASPLRGGAQ